MARLSDDAEATSSDDSAQDPERESLVAAMRDALGDAVVDTHLIAGKDLWVRVAAGSWVQTATALHGMGFTFFGFLSAIDWMPSPYGRGEDDPTAEPPARETGTTPGYAGGETRFQVFARLVDLRRKLGVTLKTDVPDDTLTVGSWVPIFAGANWHERETHEMFGIGFEGHPNLRKLYLPTDFEGFPLRKDFPLLARMIKPWPGIVDVEPLPTEEGGEPSPSEPTVDDSQVSATGNTEAAEGSGAEARPT